VATLLAVDDVLVDSMRGRSSTWTRIRVNLRHVPQELRPPQETPDPDDDPTREWRNRRAGKRQRREFWINEMLRKSRRMLRQAQHERILLNNFKTDSVRPELVEGLRVVFNS